MKTLLRAVSFSCVMVWGLDSLHAASEPERAMGVTTGPEAVFDRPVADILPQLQGATATNVNGRVGSELVFWGYRSSTGAATNLFACAMMPDVDCEARALNICRDGSARIEQKIIERGNMVKRNCRAVGNVAPGDLHPGCTNKEIQNDLLVGLANCPGN
jgi:hypothetical protein